MYCIYYICHYIYLRYYALFNSKLGHQQASFVSSFARGWELGVMECERLFLCQDDCNKCHRCASSQGPEVGSWR